MNEFVEQFLVEGRELVEQATTDLLALEQQPHDRPRLDGVLRAFHTLKGAAGIIEFTAMGRALHGAEDTLAGMRHDGSKITPALIGQLLACLDQVSSWMDAMQRDGEVPGDADAGADAIVALFARGNPTSQPRDGLAANWLPDVTARHASIVAQASTALRYSPDPDCFFHGEDPLAQIATLPGLMTIDFVPRMHLPPLDGLDPFTCLFALVALSRARPCEVENWLEPFGDRVQVVVLHPDAERSLPLLAQDVLQAQIDLLVDPNGDRSVGRLLSAGQVAANVLRHSGREAERLLVAKAMAGIEAEGDADALVTTLQRIVQSDAKPQPASQDAASPSQDPAARGLRIDIRKIDALIKLTSELNVAKNALGHSTELAGEAADQKFSSRLKQQYSLLDRLVTELQRSVLNIRVLPLNHIFLRFPRLVREIATATGKSARLVVEGGSTEADKAVVESLFEPLLHVLRNAVVHGIESADARATAGKQPTAVIALRARRIGEQVIIEVQDDGRGIDVAKIRQIAGDRGIFSNHALAELADEAVIDLIFQPSFSTEAEVTGLSGRGVGMDAVRNGVERMGGRVAVESRAGSGTLVRFSLPFTVLLTRVMTVESGGQLFGVPIEAVVETVRVPRSRIAPIGASRAFVHRDRTIPLVWLLETLGGSKQAAVNDEATVLIVEAGSQIAGFEVDRFGDHFDIMLQPLEGLLAGLPGISGTTLLGDGRVLLVLDPQELIR